MRNIIQTAKDPSSHFMQNQKLELALGFLALLVGALLIMDAMDARGKKLWWPLSGLAFW